METVGLCFISIINIYFSLLWMYQNGEYNYCFTTNELNLYLLHSMLQYLFLNKISTLTSLVIIYFSFLSNLHKLHIVGKLVPSGVEVYEIIFFNVECTDRTLWFEMTFHWAVTALTPYGMGSLFENASSFTLNVCQMSKVI